MARVNLDKRKLKALIRNAPERLDEAIGEVAYGMERDAKIMVPVDTGALRNSISTGQVTALLWRVQVGMEYGPHVEYGTVKMPAQPYMRPALDKARDELRDAVARAYEEAMR